MSDQQKRGFRLPWAADRPPDEGAAAATMDPAALDPTAAAVSDDAENGLSPAAPAMSAKRTDAAPAAPDVPEVNAEADMIDTESALRDRIGGVVGDDAWPTNAPTDAPEAAAPAFHPAKPTRAPRRDNPLVAGLVKAMREAAVASRAETTSRLQAEVTARVEAIRADATTEAAALRKRVDEDIAGIRDWSKGEMARIRQETEERIEARRADAISENQRHTDGVERLIEQVESTVTAYEADMDRFFERLLAEDDPAQLAALAEQAPEAPDLSGDMLIGTDEAQIEDEAQLQAEAEARYGPEAQAETEVQVEAEAEPVAEATTTDSAWGDVSWAGTETTETTVAAEVGEADAPAETGETVEAVAETVAETVETGETEATTREADADVPESSAETTEAPEALEPSAAAEAEAAASEGLDMSTNDEWPAAVLAAARRSQPKAAASDETGHSRVFVNGLTSVAGISAFKGAVAQLPGIRSVSVSSGERGVFIFTVGHDPQTDIAEAVTSLTSFGVQITEATADSLTVTAHEPAA